MRSVFVGSMGAVMFFDLIVLGALFGWLAVVLSTVLAVAVALNLIAMEAMPND
jgi:hypothetical protein